nr:sugar kinase [Prevotella sp.]
MKNKIVTFGEVLLRLSKKGRKRLIQTGDFVEHYGGSEANVAVSLSTLGDNVQYVTRVPENLIGKAVCLKLRTYGVNTDSFIYGGDRLGSYYFEEAAAMRNSSVVYDRKDSSFFSIKPNMVDWKSVFDNAALFHFSGISCAISQDAYYATWEAVKAARQMGLPISFDVNYRKNLWGFGAEPEDVLRFMAQHADIIFGDQHEYEVISGLPAVPFKAMDSDYVVDVDANRAYFEKVQKMYPNAKIFLMATRNQIASSHHTLSGVLYYHGKLFTTKVYDIMPIVDPMGVGDAFIAAYLHAYQHWNDDPQRCLDFSLTASAMKNTIPGDFNLNTEGEIEEVMNTVGPVTYDND